MGFLEDLKKHGEPFWVWSGLLADPETLVTPRPAKIFNMGALSGANSGITQRGRLENHQIVVVGLAFQYSASAAAVGFDLYFQDNTATPAVNRMVWRARSQAAGDVRQTITPCFAVGPPAAFVTPNNAAGNPGQLIVDLTATAPTNGSLWVWGIQIDGDIKTAHGHTGSPVVF